MSEVNGTVDPVAQLDEDESGELVVGIVAPVGTDAKKVHRAVFGVLSEFNYGAQFYKLSQFFREQRITKMAKCTILEAPDFERIRTSMNIGDALRWESKTKEILGIIAASKIAHERAEEAGSEPRGGAVELKPLDRIAHVVHSLKRPEEVVYLSKVYGGRFLLLSLYSSKAQRMQNLMNRGMSEPQATELIVRDESGYDPKLPRDRWEYGQATRDTFHLADLFVDASGSDIHIRDEFRRFFKLVFGNPLVTPRMDEHAMFLAYGASLRSGDLSRQVGAVLATTNGAIVAEGANDAPGPFARPYWPGERDHRDIALGFDSNERIKARMLAKACEELERIQRSEDSGPERPTGNNEEAADGQTLVTKFSLNESWIRRALKQAGFFDITEFGRAVHAEMATLMSCASRGVSTRGLTLYCTTFPCHNCTKHLVAAGIGRVVFIEPYPKSRAEELHPDAISLTNERDKVDFHPFIGIGPKRYMELFALRDLSGRYAVRKGENGELVGWSPQGQRPVIPDRIVTYIEREKRALSLLNTRVPEPKT